MKNSHETRILFGAPGSLERILLLHDGIVEPLLKIAVSQIESNGFVLGRLFSILKPDEFIFSIYEDFFKQVFKLQISSLIPFSSKTTGQRSSSGCWMK